MDKIFIHALKAEAIIGIYDWERQVRQAVLIDIELAADIRKAALTDSIDDTLNYKRVAKRILAFVEASQFHLVETLAEHVAMLVLEEFGLAWVRITLSKPGAVRSSRDVGVALERDRARRKQDNTVHDVRVHFESLTPREQEVMGFVTSGLMNKQIAAKLGVSEITVKVHRGNVMRKMSARSLADLVRMADVLGIRRAQL